jgi:UV DNA damage endonuclease
MSKFSRTLRLGFPVKVLGQPGLKSNDTRRWQKSPHLKCSLEHVDQVLDYLDRVDIRMYRLSSDLAPYATHPDMPQFHNMVAESDAELAEFGRKARALDIRLSFHPSRSSRVRVSGTCRARPRCSIAWDAGLKQFS